MPQVPSAAHGCLRESQSPLQAAADCGLKRCAENLPQCCGCSQPAISVHDWALSSLLVDGPAPWLDLADLEGLKSGQAYSDFSHTRLPCHAACSSIHNNRQRRLQLWHPCSQLKQALDASLDILSLPFNCCCGRRY